MAHFERQSAVARVDITDYGRLLFRDVQVQVMAIESARKPGALYGYTRLLDGVLAICKMGERDRLARQGSMVLFRSYPWDVACMANASKRFFRGAVS